MGERLDEVRALTDHFISGLMAQVGQTLQIEGAVLLQHALPVGQGMQVIDQPHLEGQQPVQRACVGYVDVQSGGRRAQGAQGLKQFLRLGNLMQQAADQNGVEGLTEKGSAARRVFQKVLDHEDAIIRPCQMAGMFGKMPAGLHDGQLREIPVVREDGRHAAAHFQYASGLPEFQLGGHNPLAQSCLSGLKRG